MNYRSFLVSRVTDIPKVIVCQQSFSMKLLSVKVPNMIHKIPAVLKRLPRNGGRTLRMRRYNPLPTAMVPLGVSGITPPAVNLTAIDIDATPSLYGTYVVINEQVTLQAQDPVLNECAERLGVSMRQTEDQLTRDMLAASASFLNAVGGVNGDNPTEITRSDIDDVVSVLMGNDAYMILDNIEGEDKFATAPVRDAYFAMTHTKMTKGLESINGFIQKNQYPSPMNALRSEWGAAGNVRFLVSSIGSISYNASNQGADVYNTFIVGMESYACVEQDGMSSQFIYLPPTIAGGPLAQNATVGYKFMECPRILNDEWLINLRSTLA